MLAIVPVLAAPAFVDVKRSVAVDRARGTDRRVDYASLLRFGPWDDRNYTLTLGDLQALAPNEAELRVPIPAFFRVRMRQAWPELPRSGPAQYPRHAPEIFRAMFGGFLVDGRLYHGIKRTSRGYAVILEDGVAPGSEVPEPEAVSGEVRVSSPSGGAESAIKIHPLDTSKMIAGANGAGAGQTMYYSTDGGVSWTKVFLPLGGTGGDPAVDWSSDGTYAYATTLGQCGFNGCQIWFYRSNNGGVTWTGLETVTPGDPRREITTFGSDKEFLHVDKYPGSPFKDRIYVCWHDANVQKVAVSADFGNTFSVQAFPSGSAELGIGSDVTTGKNGEVYYLWPAFNSKTIRMKKSVNGGVTYFPSVVVASTQAAFTFPIPSTESREAFVYVSADTDLTSGTYGGSVYAAWTDSTAATSNDPLTNHARIQVAYSRDGGATWSVSTPHATVDNKGVDRWHPALAVGPSGVVHVVFYDTRHSTGRMGVDLFYSYSTDGAVTWSNPQRVTSVLSNNIVNGFEFGDYNGLDMVLDALVAVFTDNRNETGGVGDSVDVYGAGIPPGVGAVCGNATIEPGEVCDGVNLGGATCASSGCVGGVLGCAANCGALVLTECDGCPGAGAGTVPDGGGVPGAPLTVARSGSNVVLAWSSACGPAVDYAIYEGSLAAPGVLTPRTCSTGGATTATVTPTGEAVYFLVVPQSGGNEGSYGRASGGFERFPAASACLPQIIVGCP